MIQIKTTEPESTNPTHIMNIEVQMDLSNVDNFDYDALADIMRVCLSVTRASYDKVICETNVSLVELPKPRHDAT